MAATLLDYDRLRKAIGANIQALPNHEAADIFTEAATLYTGAGSIRASTRVIAIGNILGSAAKLTDYAQDTTQEKQGQVFDHLMAMLKYWQGVLDRAILDEQQTAASASDQSMSVRVMAVW